MAESVKWSEEDVKVKVILPFFQHLGFDASEIACEVHTEFRFGTGLFPVDQKARGRIDYLIKLPESPNLILVEAKRDGTPLQPEDTEQALSYAKGIDPLPQITMVTNGLEWRAFKTLTAEDISGKNIDGYDVDLGEAERFYKAIRRLRTLSQANLERFCRWHVDAHMRPLRGSKINDSKKYIPELFHEPAEQGKEFERFLGSSSQAFVVTGRSGDGKSCWMCHRALSLLEVGWHVFFFRGQDVRKGISQQIAIEASAQLGPTYTAQEFVRRVKEITSRAIVFVDGLDEIPPDVAIEVTSDFLRCSAAPGFRLVVSCKSTCWAKLAEVDEVPTELWEQAYTNQSYYSMPVLWQPSDFYPLLEKYRAFYECKARMGKRAIQEASRSPYVLRFLMEGARGAERSSLISLDHKDLYDKILLRLRARIGVEVPTFESFLISIAKLMVEEDLDSLEETSVLQALGLRITEQLPAALFDHNVLERNYPEGSIPQIRFYFGRLRDFLVSFRVYKWQMQGAEELKASVRESCNSKIAKDALELFYSLANEAQKRALDAPYYGYGIAYLKHFKEFASTNFPYLKNRLVSEWEGDAKLGFVGEIVLSPLMLRMEGIRASRQDLAPVILNPYNSDRRYDIQTPMAYFGKYTGKTDKVKQSACHAIWASIASLIKSRNLDESTCHHLLRERVIAFHAPRYGSIAENQPKTVQESRWDILFNKARRHKKHLLYSLKEKDGQCQIQWNGEYRSVSFGPPSAAEQEEIYKFAADMADSGTIIHTDAYELSSREENRILTYLDILEDSDVCALDDTPLGSWYFKSFAERTPDAHRELVSWLAENLMPTYSALAKQNFPEFWRLLPPIAKPVKLVVMLDHSGEEMDYWKYRRLTYQETRIQLVDQAPSLPDDPADWPPDLISDGTKEAIPRYYGGSSRLGEDLNNNFLIFHTLLYDQVSKDLAAAIPEFKEAADVGGLRNQAWI